MLTSGSVFYDVTLISWYFEGGILEFAFNAEYWSNFQGTLYRVIPYDYQAEFVKTRALELGAYLESIDEDLEDLKNSEEK